MQKVCMGIVSAFPTEKVFSTNSNSSRVILKDEQVIKDTAKYYHRPRAKPAVEKQTLLKEGKKQSKHG